MSMFLDLGDFEKFKKNTLEKVDEEKGSNFIPKWNTSTMKGTAEKPNTFEFRFLPDLKSKSFYKHYFYHMISVNDKWHYMICPKTFDAEAYCPICAGVQKLYKGTEDDKKIAYQWKRKERFVANAFIVDDPRDANAEEDKKVVGSVLLYEFPATLEKVLREELKDTKRGIGHLAFEPGEEGYNFVLKVGSKPGDKPGQTWPDYNLQTAKRPSPVAAETTEIKAILDKAYNLEEYLQSGIITEEAMVDLMKDGLIYDFIRIDYEKRKGAAPVSKAPSMDEFSEKLEESYGKAEEEVKETRTLVTSKTEKAKKASVPAPELPDEDAELLAELDNLGK